MNKWINVRDKCPDIGQKVLVYCKPDIEVGGMLSDGGWWIQNVGVIGDGWITHWMPLPETPKERRLWAK